MKGDVQSGMKGLSPRQKQVLDILENAVREGEQLTIREIGDRIGVSSTCTVHQHLKALERKGYIKPTNHKHRSIQLTSPPRPFTKVPFRGQVSAGTPMPTQPCSEEAFLLPTDLVGQEESLLFQVCGDGMADAAILNGDYVLVHPNEPSRDGDVVVAATSDGPILARFSKINANDPADGEDPAGADPSSSASPSLVGRVSLVIRRL